MNSFLFFLFSFNLIFAQHQENGILFEICPHSISIGDSAVLKWEAKRAKYTFISQIGEVEQKGQITIFPDRTTTYFLIADDSLKIWTESATIKVEGARGEYPEISNFSYPVSFNLEVGSIRKACSLIHNFLQNQLKYSLDWHHDPNTEIYDIVTSTKTAIFLLDTSEKKIAARQLAYFLKVSRSAEQNNLFHFQIKTFIQYRRKIELTWRNETNEKYHLRASQKLMEDLKEASNLKDFK